MAAPGTARRRARAEADGFVLRTRARFGFAAPAGSSDDPRVRLITQYLSGEVARELFAARDAGGGEQQQREAGCTAPCQGPIMLNTPPPAKTH